MSIDNRTSNQTLALKRKKMFLARVEWLPVTSRSHVTSQTDKSKISIMIEYLLFSTLIATDLSVHSDELLGISLSPRRKNDVI